MLKLFLLALMAAAALALLAAQLGQLAGKRPEHLGVTEGRLSPPSKTRNSVSSQAALFTGHPQIVYASIEPLPLRGGDVGQSMAALNAILRAMPGITVAKQEPDYLYAEAQTRWLKFVDDLEFWANPDTDVIEVRSASRLGREDFGANRKRVELIRAAYLAQP